MAKVTKKACQTSKEKAYLAFDSSMWVGVCLWATWHPAPPNACTLSPRGNIWHPAAGTGVRTPGSNCWQGIGGTNRFVHPQKERTNILLN